MGSPFKKIEVSVVYETKEPRNEITVNVLGVPMRFYKNQPRFVTIQQANILKNFGVFKLSQDANTQKSVPPEQWVKKILVARTLHSLGDMLYASVTPKALKRRYPMATITVTVPRRSMPLWFHHPWVDGLIAWDELDNAESYLKTRADLFYDITRPCVHWEGAHHPSHKSRIDIYAEHCGVTLPDDEKQPVYIITGNERAWAKEFTQGRHFLGIQLRSNSPDRNWQPTAQGQPIKQDKNKALIKAWLDRHPKHYVAVFDEHAEDVKALGLPADRIQVVAGHDMREMMAVLERCFMTLTLNSGLLVASGAVGAPALGLFGNMNPDARTGYLPGASAIWHPEHCDKQRSPCWGDCGANTCMSRITVEEVLEALEEKFKTRGLEKLEALRDCDETIPGKNEKNGGLTE
jgi:ADP-heptose:LPS heptosyltransferase